MRMYRQYNRTGWKRMLACLFCLLPWVHSHALDAAKEYEIKAAYMYNLGNFITWPEELFSDPNQPFAICILGEDPFEQRIDVITKEATISDHPITIQRLRNLEDGGGCHILFISQSEDQRLPVIFEWLGQKPILSVGDSTDFVIKGGMIMFFERDNKIRMALDLHAIRETKLKVSAHLLRVVEIIKQ